MRHRAVGVPAGDHGEAQADEARTLAAFGGQLLVDRHFGDRAERAVGSRRLVEPGVERAHRGAVLRHRLAHEGEFGGGLAALGKRARVHGLDDADALGDLLAKAQRDAPRVDQQHRLLGQRRQRGARAGVVGQREPVGGERRGQRGVDLAGADEQRGLVGGDQQVGEEDGVVVDVGAAQVGDPGDVVDGGDEVVRGAGRGHRSAHLGQLGRARLRRVRRGVFVDAGLGQVGAFVPGVGQEVGVGLEHDARGGQLVAQRLRGRQAQHVAVDGHDAALAHLGGEPVEVGQRGAGGDLDQRDAAALQLGLGLRPVAAVGEQGRLVGRDRERGHRAGEAGEVLAALPAAGQVFGQVRVAGRHQHGVDPALVHHLAQSGDAGAGGRGAGVHGCLSRLAVPGWPGGTARLKRDAGLGPG